MKKLNVLTLALCLGATSLAFAAEGQSTRGEGTSETMVIHSGMAGRGARQRPGLGAARLASLKNMDLSDEQKTKVDEIEKVWKDGFKSVQEEMLKMRQEAGTTGSLESRATMSKNLMKLDKDVNEKIDAMLTPEQAKALEERMAQAQTMTTRRMRDRVTSAPVEKTE